MNQIFVNTISVAVVLGIIVFVHELGHFLAAKLFGVRVETFSLGFGTRLLGVNWGGTDYRLSILPLGGYVKMAGENPMEQPSGHPDELLSKPRWQRFIVAFAGPFMNAVLAVGLLIPVYMREYPHNPVMEQAAVIAQVQPGSPAATAGLQPLDRIVEMDGVQNPDWQTVFLRSAISAGHAMKVTVERNGQRIETKLTPISQGPDDPPVVGVAPVEVTRFDNVMPGSPAAAAGLRAGDQVVEINDQRVLDPGTLVEQIQAAEPDRQSSSIGEGGRPIVLTVRRPRGDQALTVVPHLQVNGGQRQWMIGAAFVPDTVLERLPLGQAVRQSLSDNKQYSMVILDLVGKLVERRASLNNLQSPVGIAAVTGQAARAPTLLPLIELTSLLSLNLGILNLLPIPVLDGGMILFLLIESLLRHDINMRIKERIYQVGFAFLVILMTVVVYNDILRGVRN